MGAAGKPGLELEELREVLPTDRRVRKLAAQRLPAHTAQSFFRFVPPSEDVQLRKGLKFDTWNMGTDGKRLRKTARQV